jgi:hypothetical protein
MTDIVERLTNHISPLELDEDDQVALVPRWEVEDGIAELKSLRQQLAKRKMWANEIVEDATKELRQQLTRITHIANCETADSFLLLSDDEKRKWFAMATIESTRRKEVEQQLAEAVKMLSEQDFDYNRKTNAIIDRHSKQLAESQAREKVLRDALLNAVSTCFTEYSHHKFMTDHDFFVNKALALPSDSTALDSAIRQAKREALLEAADMFDDNGEYAGYGNELRRKADELDTNAGL